MPLYKLTYPFESSGRNIEYQTTQQVEKEADTSNTEITLVTTGLSIEDETINGIAIVDTDDDAVSVDTFGSATECCEITPGSKPRQSGAETETAPAVELQVDADQSTSELCEETANQLATVGETPGCGFMLSPDLTPYHPHEHDVWLVSMRSTEIDAKAGLKAADIVEFLRANDELIEDEPAIKIGAYHGMSEPTIQLYLAAAVADPEEAKELAGEVGNSRALNVYRFELSKASLVVGESTHSAGQVDAVFRSTAGKDVCSRDLAYRMWHENTDVSFHPLGVLVDGDLYRPVTPSNSGPEVRHAGDPILVDTYRGSESKPWQFGVSRHEEQLLITQARGPPAKFDPVLKRFPIETRPIGDQPLVFSHTVSRRLWSEDPLNLHVQSQRSEGLRTQFLYADSDGWHLIQPKALAEPTEDADSSFESTSLDGVSVRSSLLRADIDGETKATVEHEYRITPDVLDACNCLYALSYHEVNEESVERLQWKVADATAYEIISENTS